MSEGSHRAEGIPLSWRAAGWVAAFAILYTVFREELTIILVFAVAVLLAAVIHPVVTWLHERARIPRPLAILLILGAAAGAGLVLLWWVVPQIVSQVADLVRALPALGDRMRHPLSGLTQRYPDLLRSANAGATLQQWGLAVMSRLEAYTLDLAKALVALVVVLVAMVYTLASPVSLTSGLLLLWPVQARERAAHAIQLAIAKVGTWMGAQMLAMLVVGLLVGIATWLLGLPFPLLWGVFAGLLEVVPTVGPVLGGLGPLIEALAIEPIRALWVILAFTAIQQMESHLLIPLLIGRSLRLHPAAVLFVVVLMGALFGVLGVFVAVPLMAVAQAIYGAMNPPPEAQRGHAEQEARSALGMHAEPEAADRPEDR